MTDISGDSNRERILCAVIGADDTDAEAEAAKELDRSGSSLHGLIRAPYHTRLSATEYLYRGHRDTYTEPHGYADSKNSFLIFIHLEALPNSLSAL